MLKDLKGEMPINMPESKTQASVGPLAGDGRNGACKGASVASTVTEKVDIKVVVEEPEQQKTIPPRRPSKGLALPRANSESISLLLKDPCPPHGTMSVIGRRREMEDAVAAVPSFFSLPKPTVLLQNSLTGFAAPAPTPLHFFGVYDGHGGSQASIYCKNRFHEALAEELRDASSFSRDLSYWSEVMSACFMKMDMAVGGMCPNGGCSSNGDVQMINDCCQNPVAPENVGSTAVIAVVSPTQVVIANCGDSRAVLSRGGKAIPLSNDHKPEREDEMGRIEAAGGRVIYWNGYRVGGFLAMSRALGDRFLKRYVISEPEVICTERTNEDECLILASDGLWDVLSNDTVCEVARKCLAGFRPHRSKGITEDTPVGAAAALLTKLALGRGSGDNISVVVIDLKERRNRNR
ncbi:probable protein phosphatase 2C 8 isoform X2 [Cryptomeria japonica]|nr:probable protein phosphatase 2C 8 isoform X2 [Cryptomeria japonica]